MMKAALIITTFLVYHQSVLAYSPCNPNETTTVQPDLILTVNLTNSTDIEGQVQALVSTLERSLHSRQCLSVHSVTTSLTSATSSWTQPTINRVRDSWGWKRELRSLPELLANANQEEAQRSTLSFSETTGAGQEIEAVAYENNNVPVSIRIVGNGCSIQRTSPPDRLSVELDLIKNFGDRVVVDPSSQRGHLAKYICL